MDTSHGNITPIFVEHEGFTYLEFEGEFYKGCKRCGGEGHFSHNGEHSRCYDCDNTDAKLGEQLVDQKAAEKWCHERAVRRAQRIRKAEEKRMVAVRAMEARQEALKQVAPDVYSFLMEVVIEDDTQDQYDSYEAWAAVQQSSPQLERDTFIRTMAETLRWVSPSRDFSAPMIAAIRSTIEKRAAKAAVAATLPDVPTGRVQISGEVKSVKWVESDFGGTWKAVVEDASGFRVYGTLASALLEQRTAEELVGARITFTATVTPSNDDRSFGFFSRPTKASVL